MYFRWGSCRFSEEKRSGEGRHEDDYEATSSRTIEP
jgi:hypothetical protein